MSDLRHDSSCHEDLEGNIPPNPGAKGRQWILLVASQSIVDEGVLSLLDCQPDLTVAIAPFVDDARFLDDVAAIRPDVILLNEAGPLQLPDLLSLIQQSPALTGTRIILYGIKDSAVDLYDYCRVAIGERKDFLELLHPR